MDLTALLALMPKRKASDLILSAGAAPMIKVEGVMSRLDHPALSEADTQAIALDLMTERQQVEFEREMEMNLALALPAIGRFRVNVYRQRGTTAIALRYIPDSVPSIARLNLPPLLQDLVLLPRGLVLAVGSTGSGKSTTLASMIDWRNSTTEGHIITVEEPIEFVHRHKRSVVDQREIGLDTRSYANALKNAMREAPDVVMIGEIRDRRTMKAAIAYAETGHLCLSTLHANNANQALDRILNFFPDAARTQLLTDLSLNLRAVVSQRLLRGTDGRRVPAVEILLQTAYVSDLIQKGEIAELKHAMKQGVDRDMQTFDESLYRLHRAGRISYETAIEHADSRTDLALRIRLSEELPADAAAGLAMEPEPEEQPGGAPDPGWIDGLPHGQPARA
jgi:twitching motility protein PilU